MNSNKQLDVSREEEAEDGDSLASSNQIRRSQSSGNSRKTREEMLDDDMNIFPGLDKNRLKRARNKLKTKENSDAEIGDILDAMDEVELDDEGGEEENDSVTSSQSADSSSAPRNRKRRKRKLNETRSNTSTNMSISTPHSSLTPNPSRPNNNSLMARDFLSTAIVGNVDHQQRRSNRRIDEDDEDNSVSIENLAARMVVDASENTLRNQNSMQNSDRPSRFVQRFGTSYQTPDNQGESTRKRRKDVNGEAQPNDRDIDVTACQPMLKKDQMLWDGEEVSLENATLLFRQLEKLHKHWESKLIPEVAPQQNQRVGDDPAMSIKMGKKEVKNISNNSYKLLVELARKTNFDGLVNAGIVSTHPYRLPNDINPSLEDMMRDGENDNDGRHVISKETPLTIWTFSRAVEYEKSRIYMIKETLINRSKLDEPVKNRILTMWGELVIFMEESLANICSIYNMKFIDASKVALMTLDMTTMNVQVSPILKFLLAMANKMSQLNLRRGPKEGWLYREHWIDGKIPSHFWLKAISVEDFLNEVCSPANGPKALPLLDFLTSKRQKIIQEIIKAGENIIPIVRHDRHTISFRNGFLNRIDNVFMAYGSKIYKEKMSHVSQYIYAYNFFDCLYDKDGYDFETGVFDWTNRLPQMGEELDWRPANMPEKHWSKDGTYVPVIEDNVRAQRWDLHTAQNFWYALATLQYETGIFQFAPIFVGKPGTGKSTILRFPLFCVPAEFRAVIPANAEAVFGLQQLIGSDETFVKHLGAILDMNGKVTIPTAILNCIISGEDVTLANKYENSRTARATMPMVFAGNQFFKNTPEEMPSMLRRFWQFVINATPSTGKEQITTGAILQAMGSYIRRTTLVYHEFNKIKLSLPEKYSNSTNIWDFASKYMKKVQLNAMSKVTLAANFIADPEWFEFTSNDNDILSIHSLRFASKVYSAIKQGTSIEETMNKPAIHEDKVIDAIYMIHKFVDIQEIGSDSFGMMFDENSVRQNGIKCQLGDTIRANKALFVTRLRIKPEKEKFLREQLSTYFPNTFTAEESSQSQNLDQQEQISGNRIFQSRSGSKSTRQKQNKTNPSIPISTNVQNVGETESRFGMMIMDENSQEIQTPRNVGMGGGSNRGHSLPGMGSLDNLMMDEDDMDTA